MSTFISKQDFLRLRLRQNTPYKDNIRSSNCAMACNLMFLYSQYRLIGITREQLIEPLTFEEANERACLLNGLYNADLNGGINSTLSRKCFFNKLKNRNDTKENIIRSEFLFIVSILQPISFMCSIRLT